MDRFSPSRPAGASWGERLRVRCPRSLRRVVFWGRTRRCPLCGASVRRFLPYGSNPRPDALCPVCDSLERHRLAWLFLARRTNLLDGAAKRMIHFAPEPALSRVLAGVSKLDYLSADLSGQDAMVRLDIEDTGYPDGCFDVVYCSHVLEHVADDQKAMREVHRLLAKDGWAVFQVPVGADATFEDSTVDDPRERERLFGQADHVRVYGPDVCDRLIRAGFRVTRAKASDVVDRNAAEQLALKSEDLYFCQRAA